MALSDLFLINGREYEWANICVNVGGVDIRGIRGINYKKTMEKEHLHGKGRKAHSIQRGNEIVDGSITLTQSEVTALKAAAGTLSLLDIKVDVVVAYVPEDSLAIQTDVIKGVEFTEEEKGMSQGDKQMEIELPFLALDTYTL